MSIHPASEFSLSVVAPGVDEEHIAGAKNGLMTALLSHGYRPILGCAVTLSGFVVDDNESSYAAFYAVAHEVTAILLNADGA